MLKSNKLDFKRTHRAKWLKYKRKYKQTTFIVDDAEMKLIKPRRRIFIHTIYER